MRLSRLLAALQTPLPPGSADPDITGVVFDSRRVRPGSLFVACVGGTVDGHAFIPQAVAAGAAAAVVEHEGRPPEPTVPCVRVEDSRRALGLLAAAWNGFPSRRMILIGVTGTDGKTTTVNLIFHILRQTGFRAGMIGTTGAVFGGRELDTGFHVTTPDAPALQEHLAQMAAGGITHCVIEVTSHGLAQRRVAGCEFDLAVLTNITHEHLDYHGTFEEYRSVKAGLFAMLEQKTAKLGNPTPCAVLNADDPSCEYLRGVTKARVVTYGVRANADFTAAEIHPTATGLRLTVRAGGTESAVTSPLLGEYNAANILAALAVCVQGLGIDARVAAQCVATVPGVPGRMERIDLGQEFLAIVDFAHTPNALGNALRTARALARGRVIAVFGSAGLRDRKKRRQMAAEGIELADLVVLTAEDPRTESPDDILAEMAEGARAGGGVEGKTFFRIPDRGEAVRFAVDSARPGDLVIACGKGHEQSMCFGEVEYPWDDRLAMRAALAKRLGVPGPAMPVLPTTNRSKEDH
jgi:UDP-N-acetylmuramoyl-L-alanyl-D-glutamate--2,6-diaminopimelate ligase